MSQSTGASKKQFHRGDGSSKHVRHRRPRRGGPGMLLTCETGREQKCRREGLDILKHYLDFGKASRESDSGTTSKLSLDDELAQLRAKGAQQNEPSRERPFDTYNTSCRGVVFFMCMLPNCALIPPICVPKADEDGDDDVTSGQKRKPEDKGAAMESSKRLQTEKGEGHDITADDPASARHQDSGDQNPPATPPWDPLQTVKFVLDDLKQGLRTAPSSRFVTRMIPVQATCFASVEEIRLTARAVIDKYLAPFKASSFAVTLKRRNCSNVTRDDVILTVVDEVRSLSEGSKWTVDLKHPAYTIHVEVVQTLCGISVLQDASSYSNFNLAAIREEQIKRNNS